MLKKYFCLVALLLIPFSSALAETDKSVTVVNDIFRRSLILGLLSAIKLLWPYMIAVVLIGIAFSVLEKKLNNKIDSWKNKRKGGKS